MGREAGGTPLGFLGIFLLMMLFLGNSDVLAFAPPAPQVQEQNESIALPGLQKGQVKTPKKEGVKVSAKKKHFRVGTKVAPPFAFQEDGKWVGLAIELWERMADKNQWTFDYTEYGSVEEMLNALVESNVDVGVSAITITPERFNEVMLTPTFGSARLGIVVRKQHRFELLSFLQGFVSLPFIKTVFVLLLVLFVVGLAIWWIERKRNSKQFSPTATQGIMDGIWWSAVTMTTVGFGDKAPVTLWGRVVAMIWMFASVIIISTFTGALASSLTLSQIGTDINSPEDLAKVRVGVLPGSTAESWMVEHHIGYQEFETTDKGLEALDSGLIKAFVNDASVLRYSLRKHDSFDDSLQIVNVDFDPGYYAFAMPKGSAYAHTLNMSLVEVTSLPGWGATLKRYLGE